MAGEFCASFDELFRAARGRAMTPREKADLKALPQGEVNAVVRRLVAQTGDTWVCEDVVGTDGVTYTAFRPAGQLREPK